MEQLEFKFTLQDEPDEKGIFRGHASVFNAEDSYNEIVEPGAFKKTLKENKHFPMLDTHDVMRRLGIIYALEDETGLQVEGHYNLDVQIAREARSLAKQGAFNGLSIGFQTIKDKVDGAIRHLKEIKLWEISQCVFQACPGALIEDVKSMNIESLGKALIGWTTDKTFTVNDSEIPLLINAGESIKALLERIEPERLSLHLKGQEPLKPQDDPEVLERLIGLNVELRKTLGGF